ncbi:hypothetical protein RBH29_15715 [Herbivorax sp. ANBcel31]|uniref:hypothetical protein n=1 Tax=Herbivorax sp. ANBcel31 TaxID=3069754 RepID=UPI0027B355E5|nr:hypothetical protein [Herbivorax sp. ANBcel31]MDQ2087878.1 hypothetical protein [Herbivorax sp. ANBcel31]
MRHKLLTATILMMTFAYIISYYLLCSTPPYQRAILTKEGLNMGILIFTNLTAVLFAVLAYYLRKSIYKAVAIVCILFCSFAVLPHSKILIGSKEIENYLSVELTAIGVLVVVVLLMFALRLKEYEKDLKDWSFEGVEKKEIHKIIKKRIRFYSFFNILEFAICLFLIGIGFTIFYENPSSLITVFTAVTGLVIIIGCVVFIAKRISYTR